MNLTFVCSDGYKTTDLKTVTVDIPRWPIAENDVFLEDVSFETVKISITNGFSSKFLLETVTDHPDNPLFQSINGTYTMKILEKCGDFYEKNVIEIVDLLPGTSYQLTVFGVTTETVKILDFITREALKFSYEGTFCKELNTTDFVNPKYLSGNSAGTNSKPTSNAIDGDITTETSAVPVTSEFRVELVVAAPLSEVLIYPRQTSGMSEQYKELRVYLEVPDLPESLIECQLVPTELSDINFYKHGYKYDFREVDVFRNIVVAKYCINVSKPFFKSVFKEDSS